MTNSQSEKLDYFLDILLQITGFVTFCVGITLIIIDPFTYASPGLRASTYGMLSITAGLAVSIGRTNNPAVVISVSTIISFTIGCLLYMGTIYYIIESLGLFPVNFSGVYGRLIGIGLLVVGTILISNVIRNREKIEIGPPEYGYRDQWEMKNIWEK